MKLQRSLSFHPREGIFDMPMRSLAIMVLVLTVFLQSGQAVEIIAHRGASADAPENTLASARLAFQQGSDCVECDIFLTKDGCAAVIHDASTKRTTGVDKKIGAVTLAEIQTLDAAAYFKDKKYAGEKIPSLEEIIAVVPDGKKLVVELKGGKELIPAIRQALAGAKKKTGQIEFICFNLQVLAAVKQAFPEHRALWLLGYKKDKTLEDAIAKCKEAKIDGLDLSRNWPINDEFVKKVKDAGLLLYVYTVNDLGDATAFWKAGVDAITTDKPGFLRTGVK